MSKTPAKPAPKDTTKTPDPKPAAYGQRGVPDESTTPEAPASSGSIGKNVN